MRSNRTRVRAVAALRSTAVRVVAIVVGLTRAEGVSRPEGRCRARASGVLPLGLGGQAITPARQARKLDRPAHRSTVVAACRAARQLIARLDARLRRHRVREDQCVPPRHVLHRAVVAAPVKTRRAAAGHRAPLKLSDLRLTDPEAPGDDHLGLPLVLSPSDLARRAAHFERSRRDHLETHSGVRVEPGVLPRQLLQP